MRPVTMWKTLRHISGLGRMCMYADDPQDLQRFGVWVTDDLKESYQLNANSFLRQEVVRIEKRFVSVCRPKSEMLAIMREQFQNYVRQPAPNNAPSHRPTKAHYTGKETGQDDWIVAFQQGLYFGLHFWQRDDYLTRYRLKSRYFHFGLLQAPVLDEFDYEVDRKLGLLTIG